MSLSLSSPASHSPPPLVNPHAQNGNDQAEDASPTLKLARYTRYLREVWAPGTPHSAHFARLGSLMEGMVTTGEKVADIVHSIMLVWILNDQQALNPHLFKQAFLSLNPVLLQHLDLPEVINFTLTGLPDSETSLFLCSNVDAILEDAFGDSDDLPGSGDESREPEENGLGQPRILVPDTPPEQLEGEGGDPASPLSPSPPSPWYTALLQMYLDRGYNLLAERYLSDPMLCRAQRGIFPAHLTPLQLDRSLDRFLLRRAPQLHTTDLSFQDFVFLFLGTMDAGS